MCQRPPLSCGSVPFCWPLQSMLASGRVPTAATVLWLCPLLLASAVHARFRARAHGRHCPVALSLLLASAVHARFRARAHGRHCPVALSPSSASAVHARFRARAHGRHCPVALSPSSGLCSPCTLQGACPRPPLSCGSVPFCWPLQSMLASGRVPTAATVLWLCPLLLASAVKARFRARAHGRHCPVAPSPSAGLCSPCSLQGACPQPSLSCGSVPFCWPLQSMLCSPCSLQGACPRPPLSCGSVPFFWPLQSMLASGRVPTATTVLWLRPLLLASAVHAHFRARGHSRHCPVALSTSSGVSTTSTVLWLCPLLLASAVHVRFRACAHGRHCPVALSTSSGLCSPCSLQGACPWPPLSCGSVPFCWPLQSMLASVSVPTAATILWLCHLLLASAVHAHFRALGHSRHYPVALSTSSGMSTTSTVLWLCSLLLASAVHARFRACAHRHHCPVALSPSSGLCSPCSLQGVCPRPPLSCGSVPFCWPLQSMLASGRVPTTATVLCLYPLFLACKRPPLSCGSVSFFWPPQSMLASGRVPTAATVLWLCPLLLASAVHARFMARAHGRHCPVALSPSAGPCSPCSLQGACPQPPLSCGSVPFCWPLQSMLCSPCSLQGACPRPPVSCGSVPFFWPLQSMLGSGRVPTAATILWLCPLLACAVHARFRAHAHRRHCPVALSPSCGVSTTSTVL
ncbi:hypothetical protein NDU88_009431 [Pleurodeles waltl]|uniref:Uncharacterized protein n=1 Tax=Pleurodeles waltl TaxID=8319 RepID=A0AAV7P6K0_PLEWA|nr:hypothetical protein NDU88_009431 [Pleurodeles waltl]